MRSVASIVDQNRSCQVFEGGANGLENGPLDRVAATCSLSSAETCKRSSHGPPIKDTSRKRSEKVAAFHQGFIGVDVDACVPETRVIRFAHSRSEAANEVEMTAGAQPLALDQRLGR